MNAKDWDKLFNILNPIAADAVELRNTNSK